VGGEAGASENDPAGASPSAGTVDIREEDYEKSQSFWRYLLAAVFLLMVSETVLSNGLSRHRVKEREEVTAAG